MMKSAIRFYLCFTTLFLCSLAFAQDTAAIATQPLVRSEYNINIEITDRAKCGAISCTGKDLNEVMGICKPTTVGEGTTAKTSTNETCLGNVRFCCTDVFQNAAGAACATAKNAYAKAESNFKNSCSAVDPNSTEPAKCKKAAENCSNTLKKDFGRCYTDDFNENTDCSKLVSSANQKCKGLGILTKQTALQGIVDSKRELLKDGKDQLRENEKDIEDLKTKSLELNSEIASENAAITQMLQKITDDATTEIEMTDASLKEMANKLEDATMEIQKAKVDATANIRKTELEAGKNLRGAKAMCQSKADQYFDSMSNTKNGLIGSKKYTTKSLGSLVGNKKRFDKLLDQYLAKCLESDFYLDGIKDIQAARQAALDTIADQQKLIDAQLLKFNNLYIQSQAAATAKKDKIKSMLPQKLQQARQASALSLSKLQAQAALLDQQIKALEARLEEQKTEAVDNKKSYDGAACQVKCMDTIAATDESDSGDNSKSKLAVLLENFRKRNDACLDADRDCNIETSQCSQYSPAKPPQTTPTTETTNAESAPGTK